VRAGAAAALLLAFACEAHAQDAREHIEPDQPDVTNGTHIVSGGLTQIEFGGIYSHDAAAQKTASMPFTIRIGVADWLEARVGADGVLTQQNGATRATGFGNVQLGAKLRLWADPGGVPVFSVLPTINLPMASAANGLGSGDVDLTLALLTGTDIGSHGRVDFNYGIGSIGGGAGRGRFVQHLLSTSISAAAGPRWNPYVEVFWFSRTEIDGTPETSVDSGAIYELGTRFAIDGGIQAGIHGPASTFAVFGGLSIVVGPDADGVHARHRRTGPHRSTTSAGT